MGTAITFFAAATHTNAEAHAGDGTNLAETSAAVDLGDASSLRLMLAITETSRFPGGTGDAAYGGSPAAWKALGCPGNGHVNFGIKLQQSSDGVAWRDYDGPQALKGGRGTILFSQDLAMEAFPGSYPMVVSGLDRYVRAVSNVSGTATTHVTFSLTGTAV